MALRFSVCRWRDGVYCPRGLVLHFKISGRKKSPPGGGLGEGSQALFDAREF